MKNQREKLLGKFTIFVMAGLLLGTGCIKKRADKPVQGSGLENGNVVTKSSVLDVVEHLTAGAKREGENSREYDLIIEESAKEIFDDYGYVDYKTESKLLNNGVRVIAKPGVKYKLVRKLEGENLIIYKVSAPGNISYIEKTGLMKSFPGGEVGVPLVSFPVSYYRVIKIKDADNRETNQYREERVTDFRDFSGATHIQVGYSNRTVYTENGVDKKAFIPKSFLKGKEWYYSVFKTDSSDFTSGGNKFEFIHTKESGEFGIYRRVKFEERDSGTFAAVSSVLPDVLLGKEINSTAVTSLKGRWVKLRVETDITGSSKEVEDKVGSYKNSNFFEIDFKESFKEVVKSIYLPGGDEAKSELYGVDSVKKVIIAQDMLSFIVENESAQYRVNFWQREESDYQPVVAQIDDSLKRFGLMYTGAPVHNKSLAIQTREDLKKVYRLVRFDPRKKTVVYHISEESPKNKVVEISAQRAIKYIDDSFAEIYRDKEEERIHVVLSGKRVKRGDPRYNILDYNSEQNTRTYGGLGNPYYDPVTGEVIKATSYIYYGISMNLLQRSLNEYMQELTGVSKGLFEITQRDGRGSATGAQTLESAGVPFKAMSLTRESLEDIMKNMPEGLGFNFRRMEEFSRSNMVLLCRDGMDCRSESIRTAALGRYAPVGFDRVEFFQDSALNKVSSVENDMLMGHNVFHIGRRSAFGSFDDKCEIEKIESAFVRVSGSAVFFEDENVKNCLDVILTDALVPTIAHEVLHNFGLRHNMSGSGDKTNYLTPEKIKEVYGEELGEGHVAFGSNSIMDYFEYRSETLPYPSTYDWAALRYIYRQQVENEATGEMVSLIQGETTDILNRTVLETISIEEAEKLQNLTVKKYKFCLQSEISWGTDPMCDTFDIGASPLEVVENYIEEYNYILRNFKRRGLRNNIDVRRVNAIRRRSLRGVTKFYKHWRKALYYLLGSENKYLEGYSNAKEFYDDFSDKVLGLDLEARARILEYFKIRSTVYNFLRDQVFMAPYSCIYKKKVADSETVEFVDFDLVYREMEAEAGTFEGEGVSGCDSPLVIEASSKYLFEKERVLDATLTPEDVQLTYAGSLGEPVRDYKYSLYESRRVPGGGDLVGFRTSKAYSALHLLTRQYVSNYGENEAFFPSFLDEPEFRDNFSFFLKARFLSGYWISNSGSSIGEVVLNTGAVRQIQTSPEHEGFRRVLNAFAEEGIEDFQERNAPSGAQYGLDLNDPKQAAVFVSNAYVQNILIERSLLKNNGDTRVVMGEVFKKRSIESYISESDTLPLVASFFRSGLTVPNNLSVTKTRTEKYLVGITRDYAYLPRIRQIFDYVADLGTYIVYSRDEKSTFSRSLISESEFISDSEKGLRNPAIIGDLMNKYLGEVLVSLAPEFPSGEGSLRPLENEKQPTVLFYSKLTERLGMETRRFLKENTRELNEETVSGIIEVFQKAINGIMTAVQTSIESHGVQGAFDEFGNVLTYAGARQELVTIARALLEEDDPAVTLFVLPTTALDVESLKARKELLLSAVSDFERNYLLLKETGSDSTENVEEALLGREDFLRILNESLVGSMTRRAAYLYNERELEEKRELLSKFLITLAISR